MKHIVLLYLIVLSFTAAAESGEKCFYDSFEGHYLGGCHQDCLDFSTFQDAKTACNTQSDCGGITFSKAENGGKLSTGKAGNGWGYQLRRATDTVKSKNGETSWRKNICNPEKPLAFEHCDFIPVQGKYLSGCFQDCKDFATRQEAINACKKDFSCKGITFSKKASGQASTGAFDGNWGYQLRTSKGSGPLPSPQGEDSWLKPSLCGFRFLMNQNKFNKIL